MSQSTFVVPVADLERGAKTVTWPIPVSWLQHALQDAHAAPAGEEGKLELELSKNGSEVLVRGRADVSVTVPCVVTLEPLPFRLEPEILLLLSPAPTPPGTAARGGRRRGDAGRGGRGPKKAGSEAWTEDPELSNKDAARDTFQGDKIVLDDFVREFILLELPMYPRRSDLPLDETPARGTPLPPPPPADLSGQAVDPRLLPLAELRDRLRQNKKE